MTDAEWDEMERERERHPTRLYYSARQESLIGSRVRYRRLDGTEAEATEVCTVPFPGYEAELAEMRSRFPDAEYRGDSEPAARGFLGHVTTDAAVAEVALIGLNPSDPEESRRRLERKIRFVQLLRAGVPPGQAARPGDGN